MKAKVVRGGGFRGALDYAFNDKKSPEMVGGNMGGKTSRELAHEFAAVRQLRPDIERPVWACSLALPKGERIEGEKWSKVAEDFMKKMGFDPDKTPFITVRHKDTEHDHIHIVASRVGLDGQVWLGKWEARKAIEASQDLEKEHGLTRTAGLEEARERKALTGGELSQAVRTGEEPPRQQLQRLVDAAAKGSPSAVAFAERLEASGVKVRANLASTGRMNGFSYELGGIAFKGSDLGDAYKWAALQKRGVTYEQERDSKGLERFRAANADRGEHQDVARGAAPDTGSHEGVTASSGPGGGQNDRAGSRAQAVPGASGAENSGIVQGVGAGDQHNAERGLCDGAGSGPSRREDKAEVVENRSDAVGRGDDRRSIVRTWAERFREAVATFVSSAKSRLDAILSGQMQPGGIGSDQKDRQPPREVSFPDLTRLADQDRAERPSRGMDGPER